MPGDSTTPRSSAQIVKFLQTGPPPVTHAETLEIYAFMEAADESTRRGGVPLKLAEVLATICPPREPV